MGKIAECYETVIASLADHIENLQRELHFKQKRIDQLELQNEAYRIRLSGVDSSRDPFTGGELIGG